ncbi:uncharacterized protein LOC119435796 [Dermacentor silvarum]|uniref:uncharacterized protein LOC119435796 n=1 Tax=Dermacentor silvarum TaxID=543639 RepID=UPI001897C5DC|nr:uncharacterized protein LOC119435796 [Dermacentor silvarum]
MSACRLCVQTFSTLPAYFNHYKYHSSVLGGALCPSEPCDAVLKNYESLKSHLFRHHRKRRKEENAVYICPVISCEASELTRTMFLSHIATHFSSGTDSVTCPFTGCVSVLTTAQSFRTHVSRYHSGTTDALQHLQGPDADIEMEAGTAETEESSLSMSVVRSHDVEPSSSSHFDENLFTDNFALFLLKLESQHHVPASTVQNIIKEMQNLHSLNRTLTLQEVSKAVSNDTLAAVNSALSIDPFGTASLVLNSSYSKHKYYKANFCFVPPVEITLGMNKQNVASVCCYVPIEDLICFLLCHAPTGQPSASDGCYHDYIFCQPFKQSDENVIRIILYQDEFEIVNPLGSSKGHFKLLAVYMTLGNLPLYCRSRVESMQLVMLCRQKDVREFGLQKVLQPLTESLVMLEQKGLPINGVNHHVRLDFVVGDNLGSHMIGGFTQSFSTSAFICRFCLLTRLEFHEKPHLVGERRTPEKYMQSLERLESSNEQSDCGIVNNSPFHVLRHFHVCRSGLPPCIGHDLFEGVVRHDLPLYIRYFVTKKRWFTYEYLNNRISTLKYSTHDLRNKPAKVPSQSDKLGGHAIQNWTLLRLLPLYIGTKVADTNDPTWELVVKLMEVTDLIMAPKITAAQVAYLKILTEDYIVSRSILFPSAKLRPKHHYMLHYSELIQEFGPLCHVWTMRFEGKHQYFKQCIRSSRNFKNVTKTLSERHQLYQSFLAARGLFRTSPVFTDMSQDEQTRIQSEVVHCQIREHSVLLKKATVDGCMYAVDDYVLVSGTRFDPVFGLIIAIVKNISAEIFLLVKCVRSACLPGLSLYVLQSSACTTELLCPFELLDRTAYQPYAFNGATVIRLNLSFPETL